jgi:hypothetical protein
VGLDHVSCHHGDYVALLTVADGQLVRVAGVVGFPRGCEWVRWKEDDEVNLAVVAPPPNGRRNLAGGETERQSSRYT